MRSAVKFKMLKRQRGFSLVSTMVGLTIGLLVGATTLGTALYLEASKSSAMGGSNALVNGAMGVFRISGEVKQAGLGMMYQQNFACPTMNLSYDTKVMLDGVPLYPASIVDGATASDTVSVAYLDSLIGATAAQILLPMTDAASAVKLSNAPDADVGSVMLLQDPGLGSPCTLVQVSASASTSFGTNVEHTGGLFNSATFTNPVAYSERGHAASSRNFVWSTFRVRNNTLEELNNITGVSTVIADGVVALKAQYGITDGTNMTVSSWVSATGTYAAPTSADMLKVRAIRIGLLTRSLEKGTTCTLPSGVFTLWTGGPTVNVTTTAKWNCYRYRTFDLVIPLINVAMGVK
jgi:type IV pilus assembly protein PilW